MISILLIFLLFMGSLPVYSDDAQYEDPRNLDRSHWIDPTDMINFDPHSTKHYRGDTPKPGVCEQKLEKIENDLNKNINDLSECRKSLLVKEECPAPIANLPAQINSVDIALLQHLLKKLLKKLDFQMQGKEEIIQLDAVLQLSKHDLQAFEKLVNEDNHPDLHEAKTCVDVFDTFIVKTKKRKSMWAEPTWLEMLQMNAGTILQIANMIILLPAAALVFYHVTHVGKLRLSIYLGFLCFWLSVVWTWLHLYKEKQAELATRLETVPKECETQQTYSLYNWLKNVFTISVTDSCVQYQKDLLIDPFWEVTPIDALTTTIAKFFLKPLKLVGQHSSEFMTEFFGNLHWTLWVPGVALLLLCAFLPILLFFGYTISMPFGLLRLERGQRQMIQQPTNASAIESSQRNTNRSMERRRPERSQSVGRITNN